MTTTDLVRGARVRSPRRVTAVDGLPARAAVREPAPRGAGLVGLQAQTRAIEHVLDDLVTGTGSVLIVSGHRGVGKSAVLDAADAAAAARGLRVLRAAGTPLHETLDFLALAQLLLGLRGTLDEVRVEHRETLEAALGLSRATGSAPNPLRVCNAVLALLAKASENAPLLLVVDDLQWLDRASAMVLGFVARAVSGTRVAVLGAARSGEDNLSGWLEFPRLPVDPLDVAAAHTLLQKRFPALPTAVRRRIVDAGQGVPLALLEYARDLNTRPRTAVAPLAPVLPLPRRLQSLFGARVAELGSLTRHLLLLVALDGSGELRVLHAAAGSEKVLDHLDAAERSRLIEVDESTGRVAFPHPLVRSAVVDESTSTERRRAHRTLATVWPEGSEQRAWHLAHATVGPDETIAHLVERSARAILRRGDGDGAVQALIRASQLSETGVERGRRLAEAAAVAAEVCADRHTANALLLEARRAGAAAPLPAAVATAALWLLGDGGDVDRTIDELVRAIAGAFERETADDDALLDALRTLARVCRCAEHADGLTALGAFLGRLRSPAPLDLRLYAVRPPAPSLLAELDQAVEGLEHESDLLAIVRLAAASLHADRLPACVPALRRVVDEGQAQGAQASVVQARWMLALCAFWRGDWEEADAHLDAGRALCAIDDLAALEWPGLAVQGLLAAGRGDHDGARASARRLSTWAAPLGAQAVAGHASTVLAAAALTGGDFDGAFAASSLGCGVLDRFEAAVRTGRADVARADVRVMIDTGLPAVSPRLGLLTAAGDALTGRTEEAEARFEHALSVPGGERWAFEHARVRLLFAEHLRRRRCTRRAREQLRRALDVFERIGATPWVARAEEELAAAGEHRSHPGDRDAPLLTPQELEIARLAAEGLSNKQIGARLHLSHRTVSTHLYRIYPRLGVSSRVMLREALSQLAQAR